MKHFGVSDQLIEWNISWCLSLINKFMCFIDRVKCLATVNKRAAPFLNKDRALQVTSASGMFLCTDFLFEKKNRIGLVAMDILYVRFTY